MMARVRRDSSRVLMTLVMSDTIADSQVIVSQLAVVSTGVSPIKRLLTPRFHFSGGTGPQ